MRFNHNKMVEVLEHKPTEFPYALEIKSTSKGVRYVGSAKVKAKSMRAMRDAMDEMLEYADGVCGK